MSNPMEMMVRMVSSEDEFHAAEAEAKALGLSLAVLCTTGLQPGHLRLGFMSDAAYAKMSGTAP